MVPETRKRLSVDDYQCVCGEVVLYLPRLYAQAQCFSIFIVVVVVHMFRCVFDFSFIILRVRFAQHDKDVFQGDVYGLDLVVWGEPVRRCNTSLALCTLRLVKVFVCLEKVLIENNIIVYVYCFVTWRLCCVRDGKEKYVVDGEETDRHMSYSAYHHFFCYSCACEGHIREVLCQYLNVVSFYSIRFGETVRVVARNNRSVNCQGIDIAILVSCSLYIKGC